MSIKICSSCEGKGEIRVDESGRGDWSLEKCSKCNGTGRLKTREYSYEVPFSMGDAKIYKADKKIINIIRDLQSGE